MSALLQRLYRAVGVKLSLGLDSNYQDVWKQVRHATMTSPERITALCDAVDYLCQQKIEGDFVECGVWKGGSTMAMLLMLIRQGDTSRKIHLYDTFTGMPDPLDVDKRFDDASAQKLLAGARNGSHMKGDATQSVVRHNLEKTAYPMEKITFVVGEVEKTIPSHLPERIALLRLDTDWYTSTKHELENLYPRLVPGGILIIDDYGYWKGCRKAVDEYFNTLAQRPFLSRIDECGRLCVKPTSPPDSH